MLTSISPPPGLDSNDTTFSAQGRWAGGNNVRFYQGQPQVVGEYSRIFTDTLPFLNTIFPFTRSGVTNLAFGTADNGFFISVGDASPADRSSVGCPVSVKHWSFAAWGSTLLASPHGGTLYEQIGSSSATAVSAAPDQITAMLVTPQRQVLAFGCNEEVSTTFNGLCIRGSDLEDYTDWTTTSTNNAFEHILDGAGVISGAAVVGRYIAVWTNNALYLGQFIGDPGQAYRFDKVAENCGAINQRVIAVVAETAYWLDHSLALRSWTPGGSVGTIPCPISRAFMVAVAAANRDSFLVCHAPKFNELWICTGNSGAIAVSLDDGTWFKSDIPIFAMVSSELLRSIASGLFDASTLTSDGASVFGFDHDANQTASGPTSWYLETADQYLDNSQRRMMIRGVTPDFQGLGAASNDAAVSLTLFCRNRPQSTAVAKGPYTIVAGATKKDLRVSGKIIAFRLEGDVPDVNRELRIGKLLFDIVPLGER